MFGIREKGNSAYIEYEDWKYVKKLNYKWYLEVGDVRMSWKRKKKRS